ncbi:ribonuclease III [Arcanobacterium haemolyticum]|nr:ribonuclease III [Arcanobacterium haemolyticum]
MSYHDFLERWGAEISRPMLRLALTHRSFAYEHDEPHNERLEFLGDSILGLIVADKVFREYPHASEGDMSRMKTYAVSEPALADIARALDLGEFIRLGRGEKLSGGRDKDSILSDTVEALIAATYVENGMEVTTRVVDRLVAQKILDASVLGPNLDWQTSFEELAHAQGYEGTLQFDITSEGPDHARIFTAHGHMGGRAWGTGRGTSQRKARHKAAEASFKMLQAELTGHDESASEER